MNVKTQQDRPSTVDEAISAIRIRTPPLDVEQVSLRVAHGRVLREPVRADADQPPFDRSSMDGYAIRLDDKATSFRVVDRIRAGDWKPRQLRPGEAVQIATGGALPAGRLRVVMKEDVSVKRDRIVVLERRRDRNIRFKGEDAKAGDIIVHTGTTLGPGALALLASVGCTKPTVTRLPRVLHLTTGNEIVPPGQTPEPGEIRDSNTTLVRTFLERFCVKPKQRHVAEARTALHSALRAPRSPLDQADLLLVSGGASVGEHDFTRCLLEDWGCTIHVSRTTTRPGRPMIFASRGDTVAFGLPGNPLAHFVCLNLYVRQALWRFSGATAAPDFSEGVLSEDFVTDANPCETLWPARMDLVAGEVRLALLHWQSSGDLTSLATANALARIPPNQKYFSHGGRVPFLPT